MSAGPSSSRSSDEIGALSTLFPQVEKEVLQAVLDQEGSYEAAVEVLLNSVESTVEQQVQNDEQIARALQAQTGNMLDNAPWSGLPQLSTEQIADMGYSMWNDIKQAAYGVSESVTSLAQGVTSYVAPSCIHGEVEDNGFNFDATSDGGQHSAVKAPETKKDK